MTEVFRPRANMVFDKILNVWVCRNEYRYLFCDGGPSVIRKDGSWLFAWSDKGIHRLDGPANSKGEWWINGDDVTKEVRKFARESGIKLKKLTDEDRVMIALKFG